MTEQQMFGGRYRIETAVGDGGMARVYRAYDNRLARTVALKVLREQFAVEQPFVERFVQEARLAAGLAHPNIIGVYDVGTEGDTHFIVMEYVDGENLRQVIAREAPMALETATAIVAQLGAALDYAHEHGVVHRDIKPENILVTDRGEVKVGDFGIARALAGAALTATGTVLGSVSYFSPEQAEGKAATAESDLYSMGIVLYEMLTRQVPFAGPNPVAVAMAQVNEPPPPPRTFRPDLPPAVEAVVLKAIAKNPAARYHSGRDLLQALHQALQPAPARAGRRTAIAPAIAPTIPNPAIVPAPVPRPPRRGSGGAVVALITTLVLLIAAVAVALTLNRNNDAAPDQTATATAPIVAPAASGTPPSAPPPSVTVVAPVIAPSSTQQSVVAGPTSAPPANTAAPVASATPLTTQVPIFGNPATADVEATPATSTPAMQATAASTGTPPPSMTPVVGSVGNTTVTLVTAMGVSGLQPVNPTSAFPAKTAAVYAVASLQHKPKGKAITFIWRYPNGKTFAYANPYVAPYTDTTGYAELIPQGPGTYAVSVSMDGHALASTSFTVGVPGKSVSGGAVAPPATQTDAALAGGPVSAGQSGRAGGTIILIGPGHAHGHAYGRKKHGKSRHGHDA